MSVSVASRPARRARAAIAAVVLLSALAFTPAAALAEISGAQVGGGQRVTGTPRIRASVAIADAFFAGRPDCPLGIEVYRKALPDAVDGLTDIALFPCSIWIASVRTASGPSSSASTPD